MKTKVDFKKIPIIKYKGKLYFRLSHVCKALTISNPSYALNKECDKKGFIKVLEGKPYPAVIFIDLNNLCRLMLKADYVFKNWAIDVLINNLNINENVVNVSNIADDSEKILIS